jgi:hypothetical protein
MPYGEAFRLVTILAADPSSQIAARLGGWVHPITRADMTMRDLFDLQHASKSKHRPDPYPRPWDEQDKHTGAGTAMTVAQYRAARASITKEG